VHPLSHVLPLIVFYICWFYCDSLQWPWAAETPDIPVSKSHVHFPLFLSFQRIYPSPRPCVTFCNMLMFYDDELLATFPTPKLEDHPLTAAYDCGYTYSQLDSMRGCISPIHKLSTCPAMVTSIHLSWESRSLILNWTYQTLRTSFLLIVSIYRVKIKVSYRSCTTSVWMLVYI